IMGTSLLPEKGLDADVLLSKTTDLFLNHSLQNGHPKFMGYITSSAAPIGILADLLAASVNPNVGAQVLSPVATEIEKQTVRWLAEFIGISSDCGGILVSGGNMANFTAFLAARTAKLPLETKTEGISNSTEKWTVYCSKTTHTWIEKAVVLFGLGLEAIRWIQADGDNKMVIAELEKAIKEDLNVGRKPFMVVGTAGDVSTGAVDDLYGIATICKKFDLWFHIDGAYGIPAAVVPELKDKFNGIKEADSIALDPHKWLYAPLEAGCTLVKNPKHLTDTFSSHPEYYNFSNPHDEDTQNYYEYGLQNSRGFRALKVWLILQQVGRNGYIKLFREDIELSKLLFELAEKHPDLEAISNSLSITTLRYKPVHLPKDRNPEEFLNDLNEKLLNKLQFGGKVFLSNAIVKGKYCLRSCIVNFRTTQNDIEEIIQIIVKEGNHIVETQ
ncbi:MAG: pyridoxal-dependent decarboxylase, partial [Cyclobacteriaceae bacterium]|nr:pyridoxal-dependent decarboxylase [Cyclobacteriaceae bacterium]